MVVWSGGEMSKGIGDTKKARGRGTCLGSKQSKVGSSRDQIDWWSSTWGQERIGSNLISYCGEGGDGIWSVLAKPNGQFGGVPHNESNIWLWGGLEMVFGKASIAQSGPNWSSDVRLRDTGADIRQCGHQTWSCKGKFEKKGKTCFFFRI